MATNTIQASFGFDTDPARRDLNELERDTRRALNEVERHGKTASEKFAELFKRDPTQKAERALVQFGRRLAGGDVTGAIEGLIGRMSVLGLAAGAAVGVAFVAFEKF